jgi:hypothetical protein
MREESETEREQEKRIKPQQGAGQHTPPKTHRTPINIDKYLKMEAGVRRVYLV